MHKSLISHVQVSSSQSRCSVGHLEGLACYLQRPYEAQAPRSIKGTDLSDNNGSGHL